jgi:uncharacterized membrane protein
MSETVDRKASRSELGRLKTLTDCVYAVGLVLVITWLPLPSESTSGGDVWLLQLFAEHPQNMVGVTIGLVFIIIYWLRSNMLMAYLQRTSGSHIACSIASVFFLLLLLYVVRVSEEVAAPSRRAGESVAVALIGIAAGLAWWRARKEGLVRSGVAAQDMLDAQIEAFAEPLAALITLPFAFVGELWWNLAWLAYLPVAAVLRRRGRRAAEGTP